MTDQSTIAMQRAAEDHMAELSKALRDLGEGEDRLTRLVRKIVAPSFESVVAGPTNAPLPSCVSSCGEFASGICLLRDGPAGDCAFSDARAG
jgi:hypothetical protein